jgi:low temperature requirement protein LtrA
VTEEEEHKVTTIELFFDLVFVYAITQTTQLMADHLTVLGLAQGLAMLAALWWCWCSYAWLGNTVHADRGVARFAIFAAMAMMFLVSLTIPEAFTDFAGGLYAPIMFVACYFATCGLALAAGMWWMYFDVVARVSEHKLSSATGVERAKIASDSYTFLHLPLIAGIVLVALGLKRVLLYVADTEHHSASESVHGVPVGLSSLRKRNLGSWNVQRLVLAAVMLAVTPALEHVPSTALVGIVAVAALVLITFERIRFAQWRKQVQGSSPDARRPLRPL